MARTIFGCVNFTTKEIEFDDSAECDGSTVTGCVEDWSATPVVVKVTHSECTLDDDEACVDFSTGKFQVEVQDFCCLTGPGFCIVNPDDCEVSGCCGLDCDLAPSFLSVSIMGLSSCGQCDDEGEINGTHIFPHIASGGIFGACAWGSPDPIQSFPWFQVGIAIPSTGEWGIVVFCRDGFDPQVGRFCFSAGPGPVSQDDCDRCSDGLPWGGSNVWGCPNGNGCEGGLVSVEYV